MSKSVIAVIGGTGAEGSGLVVRWAASRLPGGDRQPQPGESTGSGR
jgi:hypothetical protein